MPSFMLAMIVRTGTVFFRLAQSGHLAVCLTVGLLGYAFMVESAASHHKTPTIVPLAPAVDEGPLPPVLSVEWSPNGQRLIAVLQRPQSFSGTGNTLLFDFSSDLYDRHTLMAPQSLRRAVFMPGTDEVLGGADDGNLWKIDPEDETATQLRSDVSNVDGLTALRVLPQGDLLLATRDELWRIDAHGKLIWRTTDIEGGRNAVVLRDGLHLVVPTLVSGTLIVSTATGKVERVLPTEGTTFAAEASGGRVVTGGQGGFVALWDVASGARIWQRQPSKMEISAIAVSPDGRIVSGHWNGTLIVMNENGGEPRSLLVNLGVVSSLSFSADGRKLASGDWGGALLIWDTHSYEILEKVL